MRVKRLPTPMMYNRTQTIPITSIDFHSLLLQQTTVKTAETTTSAAFVIQYRSQLLKLLKNSSDFSKHSDAKRP